MFGKLPGAFMAQLGELIQVVVHRGRALVGNQPVLFERVHERIDDAKRQTNVIGQISAGGLGAAVESFEDQRFHVTVGEPGVGERLRLDWHPFAPCHSGSGARVKGIAGERRVDIQ